MVVWHNGGLWHLDKSTDSTTYSIRAHCIGGVAWAQVAIVGVAVVGK